MILICRPFWQSAVWSLLDNCLRDGMVFTSSLEVHRGLEPRSGAYKAPASPQMLVDQMAPVLRPCCGFVGLPACRPSFRAAIVQLAVTGWCGLLELHQHILLAAHANVFLWCQLRVLWSNQSLDRTRTGDDHPLLGPLYQLSYKGIKGPPMP